MKWRYWALANLTWIIVLPIILGIWLEYVVQAEYDSGARVSTDGDRIMIPIAGFALINYVAVAVFNLVWGFTHWLSGIVAAQQGAQLGRGIKCRAR